MIIRQHGGDTSCIVLSGGSAGAHLSAIAALTGNSHQEVLQPGFKSVDCSVSACIPVYGPMDMQQDPIYDKANDLHNWLEKVMIQRPAKEAPVHFELVSPIVLLEKHACPALVPPFLVVHGALDVLVPVEQGRAFFTRLKALRGGTSSKDVYLELPGSHHGFDMFHTPKATIYHRFVLDWLHSVRPS